ncbi:hypothetical protein FAUST_11311 [Fusarium austroamericanum]|uniref:CBM-cenC domain-containing protein n=1 Tax=Fusarium austroamericanum TaxID=282268 RepID=A0AAN5YZ81_FUSAU|nr:hypothetical protein FAUST_11311 [Fusarium austroamericanum]
MRFVSFAAVLGAALLPAVNARPACRPDRSTTTGASATSVATTTTTAIVTSSTEDATTVDASTTYETTTALQTTIVVSATDETTTALETTIASSETASSDSTVLIPTTTAETTPAEIVTTTTEAATTTTAAAAGPTNFVKNGGFEDNTSNAWDLQNSDIANNPGNAHTGGQYLEFSVNNNFAIGQNLASQTINGLSTDRQYGFSFYANVFGTPAPVIIPGTVCLIQAQQGNAVIGQFPLDLNSVNYWEIYKVNFTPLTSDVDLSLRLRCTNNRRVTLGLGIDDVTIGDVV